jgi:hypothetical protein
MPYLLASAVRFSTALLRACTNCEMLKPLPGLTPIASAISGEGWCRIVWGEFRRRGRFSSRHFVHSQDGIYTRSSPARDRSCASGVTISPITEQWAIEKMTSWTPLMADRSQEKRSDNIEFPWFEKPVKPHVRLEVYNRVAQTLRMVVTSGSYSSVSKG